MKKLKVLKTILIMMLVLIAVIVCLDIWATRFSTPDGEGRWTSESPDGRFSVTGYSTGSFFSALESTAPGDGGGFGPGIVVLRDNKTGEVLQKARVEEITGIYYDGNVSWMIGDPDAPWRKSWGVAYKQPGGIWEGDYVFIKSVGDWPLPSKDGKMPPPLP